MYHTLQSKKLSLIPRGTSEAEGDVLTNLSNVIPTEHSDEGSEINI